jgi:beta-lactamase class C
MHIIRKIMLIIMMLTCISPAVFASVMQPADIQSTMNSYLKENNIPGAAVVVISNGKAATYLFGVANKEKGTPVTKDTIFELGSISKVFTSLLLAEQVDGAKMQLNDLVTDYVPNLSDSFDDITLLNLATHTSGLPNGVPENIKTPAQLNDYLSNYSSEEFADDHWQYSNFGIGLLGMALANQAHKNLNDMYISYILKPLHMQPIGIAVPEKLKKNSAQGYTAMGEAAQPISNSILAGAFAVKASIDDMQKFLAASIGLSNTPEFILYPMRLTQINYVVLNDEEQGLGWEIHPISTENRGTLLQAKPLNVSTPEPIHEMDDKAKYNGDKLIDKTGATTGFRAYIAVIPNQQSGIVILTNRSSEDPSIVDVGRKILFNEKENTTND